MTSTQEEQIAQFCGITGVDTSEASKALSAADWDLEAAISLFYAAADGQEETQDTAEVSQPASQPVAATSQASSSTTRRPPQQQSKLRTLRDLQPSANDDDDDENKDQDLFAGGEKSGLAVQNPNSGGSTDHFRNILNQARQNRDRPPPSQAQAPGQAPGQVQEDETQRADNFQGRAQTLGGDEAPSRVIEDARAAAPARGPRLERISRTLHLWTDGVSVDDGPLFRFDDPANAHIMDHINNGHAPMSLLDVAPDQEVDLTLEPHKDQNYVQPKMKYKPFSGSGQRLGSPTPGPNPGASTTPQAATSQPAAATSNPAPAVTVNDSVPTVTLQIRLGDGTRLTSRFNTTHTIGDVYDFVNHSQSSQRPFALVTTFPTRELGDKSLVLGDISDFKRGGVVQQKWL